VVAAATSGTLGAAFAIADDDALEWSVAPAGDSGPDGRISLRHVLDPGAHAADAIAVTNMSEVAATFGVAAGEGLVGDDGVFDIGGADPQGPGEWVQVEGLTDGQVRLEPGEMRVLPVKIAVPERATPGDHPVGIAVGVSRGDGVSVTHRVGVRVHLRVAGDVLPDLDLTVTDVRFVPSWWPFAPGRLSVEYVVRNRGNVRLGAGLTVNTVGPAGLGRAQVALDPVEELLPGEEAARTATIGAAPVLRLHADVTMTPRALGEDEIVPPPPTTRAAEVAAPSWTGIALVTAALATLAALLVARHRRRNREE
jgi:hypothetical protein